MTPNDPRHTHPFGITFQLTTEEIVERTESWQDWCMANVPNACFKFGAETVFSGKRIVVFLFETAETATLFRLFFGGEVLDA